MATSVERATRHCDGSLMLHADGTPAACTEELEGRPCAGLEAEHRGPATSCDELLGAGGCELCTIDAWGDDQWRHAVHLGCSRRHAQRCVAHRPQRVARVLVSGHGVWLD